MWTYDFSSCHSIELEHQREGGPSVIPISLPCTYQWLDYQHSHTEVFKSLLLCGAALSTLFMAFSSPIAVIFSMCNPPQERGEKYAAYIIYDD